MFVNWDLNDTVIQGANSNMYTVKTPGSYNVQITDSSTGCINKSSIIDITVNPLPKAIIKNDSSKICEGSSIILRADIDSESTYQWSKDGIDIKNASSDTFSTHDTGNYAIKLANLLGCNAISTPLTISYFPKPSVIIDSVPNTTICKSSHLILHSTSTGNIDSIGWSLNRNLISGANADSFEVTQSGNYLVQVTNKDQCKASAEINITVNQSPTAKFKVPSNSICSNSSLLFTNGSTIDSGSLSYLWQFGNGDSSSAESPSYSYQKSGKYQVQLKAVSPTGCTSIAKDSIKVFAISSSNFSTMYEGYMRVTFKAMDGTGSIYSWHFGDNTADTGKSVYHQYSDSGTYNVTLTVTNSNGCITTTTAKINVKASGIKQSVSDNLSISIFPNPFRLQTNVLYSLKQNSLVVIEVLDVNGKRIEYVFNGIQSTGDYRFIFNGPKPGTYLIRLLINGQSYENKVVQIE